MSAITVLQPRATDSGSLRFQRGLPSSYIVWLGLAGYMVLAKLLSDSIVPITFRAEDQAGLFAWSTLALYASLGLVGAWCARRTGFADAWATRISVKQRLLWPTLLGIGFGSAAVVLDLLTGGSQAIARVTAQPSFNIEFPGSLLVYTAGAIEVELQYLLFTLPFLLWLTSSVLLRGRGRWPTLVLLGCISAGFEPVLQGIGLTVMGGGIITPVMLAAYLVTELPSSAAQVIAFRKYGMLAPIAMRLGDYLMWHIAYGNFAYSYFFG